MHDFFCHAAQEHVLQSGTVRAHDNEIHLLVLGGPENFWNGTPWTTTTSPSSPPAVTRSKQACMRCATSASRCWINRL